MGYNVSNYRKIREQYDQKRLLAKNKAEDRKLYLHSISPEARELDRALSEIGLRIFKTGCEGGENVKERIEKIRREHEDMLSAKKKLLRSLSLPEDYTEIKYECEDCLDTGFVDTKMCKCMKRALILEGFRSSGLGSLIEKQSFENFSLDYYEGEDRVRMQRNLDAIRDYAESFGEGSGNLLLMGGTGLGKTHLSTAMARTLIENANDVVYESAQNIISDFESDRFRHGYDRGDENASAKYFDCDLLIIDDLGVEVINSFSISCIYNLLNTRINKGRATVISTNMTPSILRSRYDDRITSRLLGEFSVLLFSGTDVRSKK